MSDAVYEGYNAKQLPEGKRTHAHPILLTIHRNLTHLLRPFLLGDSNVTMLGPCGSAIAPAMALSFKTC